MTNEPDNKMIIPFGVTVPCHRYGCKAVLKAGNVAYNDDKGRLYCPEHNPKRHAGPSATKQEMVRAMLNPIPRITDAEVWQEILRQRIRELEDAGTPGGRE